jgi:DNA-binding beta-propeller fold protein YncE
MGVRQRAVAAVVVLGTLAAPAAAAPIVQLTAPQGCLVPGGASQCGESGMLTAPNGILVTDVAVYVTARSVGSGQGGGVAIFDRAGATGALTRRPGAAGCISQTGDGTTCADGHGLDVDGSSLGPSGMVLSPDGTKLYVASPGSDAVAVLGRNPTTGALGQDSGANGCIQQTGADVCRDGRGLVDMSQLALSPDGSSLYASGNGISGPNAGGVTLLVPGATGLTEAANTTACFQQGSDAECTTFPNAGMFRNGTGIQVSSDGANVYAGSFTSSSIITFNRAAGGAITVAGCLIGSATAGCTTAPELGAEVSGLRFAAPTQLWAAIRNKDSAFANGRYQRLDRNASTGVLSVSTTACVSDPGVSDSCAKSPYLFTANDIVFSPDGKSAFGVSPLKLTMLAFDRAGDGRLTTVTGPAGCLTQSTTSDPNCGPLIGIDGPVHVEMSPDGRYLYAVSQSGFEAHVDGIGMFRRDAGPPTCSNQTLTVSTDGSVRVPLTCTEPDQQPLTRTIVQAPAFGVLGAIDQAGAFVDFAPAGHAGTATLTFKATTANGADSSAAEVTIDAQAPATTPTPGPTPGPAAPKRITSPMVHRWRVSGRSTKVTLLTVKAVPAKAKIQLLCSGRGRTCPFKRLSKSFARVVARTSLLSLIKKNRRTFKVGAKLELRITAPGMIGKSQTFTFRRGKAPKVTKACVAPGATKPSKC